jgi:hypothetical protein
MSVPHAALAANDDLVVPLHSRRRQRGLLAQKLQHVIAGAGLFFSGIQSLSAGAEGLERALAIAGVLTAGLLIAAFARELRAVAGRGKHVQAGHHRHTVDWMDIFAAGMLFAEAAEKYHLRGHIWRPETLAAVATLGIGLFHGRLAAANERRRSLRVNGTSLSIGGRFRWSRPFTARWDEIRAITTTEREATITRLDGRSRRLNLMDLDNAPAVRAALDAARGRIEAVSR